MADTPPKLPVRERSDSDLLKELCLELRHVGVCDSGLPNGTRVMQHIREVCALHAELIKRKIDITTILTDLSKETSWKMGDLLEDCLAYPQKQPYVKDFDGIRRTLRCQLCRKAERPPDSKLFWFCESCLNLVVSALRQQMPCEGIVIFRCYTPAARCSHANADTALAAEWYQDQVYGVCEKCILEELLRRRTLPPI